jgi:hypothetical protein
MTVAGRRVVSRWALVAAAAAVPCALPSVLASLPVNSVHVTVGKVLASANQPYSGYARTQAELGLPSLPELSDVTSLLSGTTDVRVWYLAADQNRVDVVDTVGERDVYETPRGTYTWDYGRDQLTEITGTEPVRLPRAGDLLPPDLARRVLSMDQVDTAQPLPSRRIAGIDAAGLRLRPADPATTVGQVDIWADPATGLPLRVEITPRGAVQPILTSQFISVTEGAPDESTVDPPDQPVGQVGVPNVLSAIGGVGRYPLPAQLAGYPRQPQLNGLPGVGRYGAGLATFVALPLPRDVGSSAIDTALKGGAKQLTVRRGRAVLIQIPLLTVLIEQVGYRRTYLLAGFVNPVVMTRAATELSALRRPVPTR